MELKCACLWAHICLIYKLKCVTKTILGFTVMMEWPF